MADNLLYFGDNLKVLREHVKDESVDLVYLDPPFNSKANYNVLFKEVDGTPSSAQIHAFTDFWQWDDVTARTWHELLTDATAPPDLINLLRGFEQFLGHNAMLAYLVMMAPRLVQLHRVLKPTGSIYLHCDPTASHYLKVMLDAVFGVQHFLSEVIWKRTSAHSGALRYGPVHDTVLFYSKSDRFVWNEVLHPHDPDYVKKFFRAVESGSGRRFHANVLTGAGTRHGESGMPWRGYNPTAHGRHWALPGKMLEALDVRGGTVQARLDALDTAGRVYWPTKEGGQPRLKYYADELKGQPAMDVWTDVPPVSGHVAERLGYPTQKPLALLERIIQSSSNEGDMVLDPFCGCGTTIVAAQKLNRRWIGIDVTYLAVNLMENRLADMFGDKAEFDVHGIPTDWASAVKLAEETDTPRKEFELWALSLVKARPKGDPGKKGGGDKGIDGVRFFVDGPKRTPRQVIVQVKSDRKPKVAYVRDLVGTVQRENAAIGALILLHPPSDRSEIPAEAASAGYYHSDIMNKDYAKVQVLTVEGLLNGTERLDMPAFAADDLTFKKAKKAEKKTEQEKLDV